MPLDHYVSQVHLKNFYSPNLHNLMYAIRKRDLKLFTANSKSVCRIKDGNTNPYLREDRVVEEFLMNIEPRYNTAIEKLMTDKIDWECIYVIAGFIAYVSYCSPAAMRLHSSPLKALVEDTARRLDSKGLFPPPPPELGSGSLTELIQSGKIRVTIDPKYPQGIGIASILAAANEYGNSKWEILINSFDDSPFFTSDFPIAIEHTSNPRVLNRIIPLAPCISLRIHPDPLNIREHHKRPDFSFSCFRRTVRRLSHSQVMNINKLIVRCAETTVFFRDNHAWVMKFVKKNAPFRIENQMQKIHREECTFLGFAYEISRIAE